MPLPGSHRDKKQKEMLQEIVEPHLTDRVDEQEKTKETLKNGLLSFLKYVEKVEDEKFHRD